jgi:hypothetical protein
MRAERVTIDSTKRKTIRNKKKTKQKKTHFWYQKISCSFGRGEVERRRRGEEVCLKL